MTTVLPDRLAAAVGVAAIWLPAWACGDLNGRAAVASTYLHRGLEHTRWSAAYQAALEYQTGGWFAGILASTVDFGTRDGRSSEIDYYLGYGKRVSTNLAVEAVVIHYTFQGASPRDDDWDELQLTAYVGDRWTFTWGIADNWWGTDARSHFVEGTFRYPLPARFTLDTTVGYQLAEQAAGVDYGYAEAGVSRRVNDFVVRAGYAAVGSPARERFRRFAADHWVVSLTWEP